MVSSLAAQLAQGASLNSHLLVDRSKRKWPESYLFDGREADEYMATCVRDIVTPPIAIILHIQCIPLLSSRMLRMALLVRAPDEKACDARRGHESSKLSHHSSLQLACGQHAGTRLVMSR